MPIQFLADQHVFCLHGPRFTYAIQARPGGEPAHLYWGKRLTDRPHAGERLTGLIYPEKDGAFSALAASDVTALSVETLTREYPGAGGLDPRMPAVRVHRPKDGSRLLELRYAGHEIIAGKPPLAGLPATYAETDDEAQTLRVDLVDAPTGVRVELFYSVFRDHNALTRSVRVVNTGGENLEIERLLSASVDFPADLGVGGGRFLHLSGSWGRERDLYDYPLRPGLQAVESRRGTSSHAHNPFMALLASGADEEHGRVFGFSLVYSGNFFAGLEVDSRGLTRAGIGLHPDDFRWHLAPGESFQSPEAVLVFSDAGLGAMSRTYHRLYRERLCRGKWRDRRRPVLINNWEATYFDFNADRIEQLARTASGLGIELLVLDDGWFGHRDDDRSSLGDWDITDRRKLPGGLDDLARRVNAAGLGFGLWFEPEMVSPDSELYRQHPDWCLHVPGRTRSEGRNQLILDLSRPEICEEIYRKVAGVLRSAPIEYVKWDMNRTFAETGSATLPPERQREVPHRYMLGLYAMLERLTAEFPDVLFESCASGGGRYDPGMLSYMPQTWTSDDSDAFERLAIQHGTSLVYPLSSMAAHVSAVPNHQVGRLTPLATRFATACISGAFGYELAIDALPESEKDAIRQQVRFSQAMADLVRTGDFYRLFSAFDPAVPGTAWMIVSTEKTTALVVFISGLARALAPRRRLALRGLDPAADYRVERLGDDLAPAAVAQLGGDLLMSAGLPLPDENPPRDFQSTLWRLAACGS